MKLTLIHNPGAGREGASAEELTALLEKHGHAVRYVDAKKGDLDKALEKSADLVLVAGGDGTVGKVMRRASDHKMPVAILPLGSANNIADALGCLRSVDELVGALDSAHFRRFDVCTVEGPIPKRRFVEAVGLGPLAQALAAGDGAGVEGESSVRFGRAAFRALLDEAEPARIRLQLDGKRIDAELAMVEVLNVGQIGPRLRLAPSADPGDGMLDVITIPLEHCGAMAEWLDNPDAGPPPVTAHRAHRVTLEVDRPTALHVDDKFPALEGPSRFEIEIETATVRVLLPGADDENADAGGSSRGARVGGQTSGGAVGKRAA